MSIFAPTQLVTTATAAIAARTAGGRMFNFNAGPSVLPEEIIHQIQQDIWDWNGTGYGILEHSHRAKAYEAMLHETFENVRKVGSIPANYKIIFMTGGSSSQNFIVPTNLLPKGGHADYIETDFWSSRSIEDANQAGYHAHTAWSGKSEKYVRLPEASEIQYSANPGYVHFTSNNTIFGTQWKTEPTTPAGVPLVCDACSDIFSKPVDFSKYGVVYASAQKNLGVTGATIVIVREDLAERAAADVPRMLQYRTMIKEESRPNTPPHFAIYSVNLMAKWILANGGVDVMAKRNAEKAQIIYDALDAAVPFTRPHAVKQARSLMNITFRLPTPELEEKFMAEGVQHGFDGMRGHRVTGGMRVSAYNAFPREGCVAVAAYIKDFAAKNG